MKKIFILLVIPALMFSFISCNTERKDDKYDITGINKKNRASEPGNSEPELDAERMLHLLESFVTKLSESTSDSIITVDESKILGELFRELDDLSIKYEEDSGESELFNDYVELHAERYEALMMKFFKETAIAIETTGYEKIFE